MSSDVNIKRPSSWNLLTEGRTLLEFGATGLVMPLLLTAPTGDGHAVMVIPGFLASDRSTSLLRIFLKTKGYQPEGWGLGRNLGTHIVAGKRLVSDPVIDRVIELFVKSERKVSLIGWSLGGIIAREVARIVPDCVRQVISLGSPFNGPKGATPVAARLFELFNGNLAKHEMEMFQRMLYPPPVPSSAIFSRTDGVTHWQSCRDALADDAIQAENIEVRGSHTGLGHNPQVLWVIANRLAQPEGRWSPFRQNTMHQLLYPDPDRV